MDAAMKDAKVLVARVAMGLKTGKMTRSGAQQTLRNLSVKADARGWDGAFAVIRDASLKLGL